MSVAIVAKETLVSSLKPVKSSLLLLFFVRVCFLLNSSFYVSLRKSSYVLKSLEQYFWMDENPYYLVQED